MKDAAEFIGLAILVVAISWSCTRCDRADLENEKLRIEIKQLQKQP